MFPMLTAHLCSTKIPCVYPLTTSCFILTDPILNCVVCRTPVLLMHSPWALSTPSPNRSFLDVLPLDCLSCTQQGTGQNAFPIYCASFIMFCSYVSHSWVCSSYWTISILTLARLYYVPLPPSELQL